MPHMSTQDVPTWGAVRHDSVYDAVMAHYTSQRAPNTFMADLVQDPESPVARLFSAALANSKNTKVGLAGLSLAPCCSAKVQE